MSPANRSVETLASSSRERLAWAGLVVVAMVSRFSGLGVRALSHDESIHAHQAFQLASEGLYRHDPAYHGPLLFYLNAFVYWLVGATDATSRVVPAVLGVAGIAAIYWLRPWLGRRGAWLAALLMTLSPTLLFFARYLHADTHVAFLTLVWIYAAFRYLDDRRHRWLLVLTVAMALAFLAKEVAFIVGAIVGAFFLARCIGDVWAGTPWRASGAGHLAAIMLTLVLPFASGLGYRVIGDVATATGRWRAAGLIASGFVVSAVIAWWWFGRRRPPESVATEPPPGFGDWARLMAVFWLLQAGFFSSLLTNLPGLGSGIVGSLGYWLSQHGVARGSQPWFYYLLLAGLYDFLALVLGLGAAITLVRRSRASTPDQLAPALAGDGRQRTFMIFCVWWACASWLAFGIAGERMPWLLVHQVLPLCVLGGWGLARLLDGIEASSSGWSRAPIVAGGVAVLPGVLVGAMQLEPFGGREVDAVATTARWGVGVLVAVGLGVILARERRRLGPRPWRALVALGLVGLGAVLTLRVAVRLTFVNYDLATELFAYAHATPDIKQALAEIELASRRTTGGRDLEVAFDDASTWPFAWYLRDYPNARFYGAEPTPDAMAAPIIIAGAKNDAKVAPFVEGGYVRRSYRLIWWPIDDYASLDLGRLMALLRDRQARQRLWQIVHYRRYPDLTLAQWPHADGFALYVRRDLARDVWLAGPEPGLLTPRERRPSVTADLPWPPLRTSAPEHGGTRLRAPTALALTRGGDLVVADSGNDRVLVVEADGAPRLAFGSSCDLSRGRASGCVGGDGRGGAGSGEGQFREPWGVAVGPAGQIYVADTWNGRIQAFDAAGRFVRTWGQLGGTGSVDPASEPLKLYGPRGLAIDADGTLLVADTGNKRVLRFTADGQPRGQVGGAGTAPGRFLEPVGLAVDATTGTLYVADTWNRRVQRIDHRLAPVDELSVRGWEGRGPLNKPYLALDATGRVYASDPERSRILVYRADGSLEGALRLEGSRAPRPLGMAVDVRRRLLYVADHANDRILVYAIPAAAAEGTHDRAAAAPLTRSERDASSARPSPPSGTRRR